MELSGVPSLPGFFRDFGTTGVLDLDPLSSTERTVINYLAQGHRPSEIASLQGTKISTIRSHIRSIHGKLGVHSVVQAIHVARKTGFVS